MSDLIPELEKSEAGWEPAFPFSKRPPTYVTGEPNGSRIRTRYYKRLADNALVGRVWFGPDAMGPPGHAHGGSMAALLDDAMGSCCWMNNYPVLAARLTTQFRNPLPLEKVLSLEVQILRIEGRKVYTTGRVFAADDGKIYCEGECLFITIDVNQFKDS